MTKNPLYNAALAIGYIIGVVLLIFFGPTLIGQGEDSIFIPMGMLALLVLSVALMAYLFFYQPTMLLLDGKREEAVKLFLHTVGLFAVLTGVLLLVAVTVSGLGFMP